MYLSYYCSGHLQNILTANGNYVLNEHSLNISRCFWGNSIAIIAKPIIEANLMDSIEDPSPKYTAYEKHRFSHTKCIHRSMKKGLKQETLLEL